MTREKNSDEKEAVKMQEIVQEIPDFCEALKATIRKSRLTERQIYLELDIDGSHWTRILTGTANFPINQFSKFLNICGNDIALRWLAYQCGYELVTLPKVLEDKIKEQAEELQKERAEKARLLERLEAVHELVAKIGINVQQPPKMRAV